jgi:hypothetical protein
MTQNLMAAGEVKTASTRSSAGTPSLRIPDGTLEALKWLALVLMVLDHTNKFLYAAKLPLVFEAGRLAMPIFGFVLAYNLARPGALSEGVHVRMMWKLSGFGVVASFPFTIMMGWWWPLNIMSMLLLVVAVVYLIEAGDKAGVAVAVVLFIIAGAIVEFWWFGVATCLAAWGYCLQPSKLRLALWVLATLSLTVINRNLWALAAFPIIFAAPYVTLTVPRLRWAFYAAYPLHLFLLLLVQKVRL